MNTLLILGINKHLDCFYIFAYDIDENKYILIRHEKEKLLGNEKDIWNLFNFVKCDLSNGNNIFQIRQGPVFIKQMETVESKKYFKSINRSLDKFLNPYNKDGITMFSVDKISNIINSSNGFQIEFYYRGRKYKFPLRDTKFLDYLTFNSPDFTENRSKAINYINRKENDIYMVVHQFNKKQLPYISVIHSI